MKTKFLKVSLLILAFSLVLGAAVATVISANETKTPEIISQNIEYNENFSIMYAVKKSSVADPANLKLNIYDKDPADPEAQLLRTYKEYTELAAGADNNLPADSYIFTTDGVAATAMLQNIYVQATCGDKVSNVMRYSVAEYLYERLATEGISALQSNFYNSTIRFGANAQKVIGKETNISALITNYRYVTVDGGKIDGYKTGVYPIGAELSVVKDDASNAEQWRHCYYDNRGVFANEKVESTFTVKDTTKNILSLVDIVRPRLGVEDFNDYEATTAKTLSNGVVSSDGNFIGRNGNPKFNYEAYEGRGMVVNFDLPVTGDRIQTTRNNAVFSAAEATAFECSFDIKIDMPRYAESKEPAVRVMIYQTDGIAAKSYNTYFHLVMNGESGAVWLNSTTKVDYDADGWFSVRVVVYKGENKAYFYFNGSDKSVYNVAMGDKYSGDITDLEGVAFTEYVSNKDGVEGNANAAHVYIDNYFCGFTKEVKK